MIDSANLLYFLVAAGVLLVIPGPAVFYIIARSIGQGTVAGLVSTLGVGFGSLLHVIAAGAGLSALLLSSAVAFSFVKYLGAAYLIFLGLRTLLTAPGREQPVVDRKSLLHIFKEGMIVNLLNPKTALFFFAFLPQFINPEAGGVAVQFFVLGALFVAMGLISDGVYAVIAGWTGHWFAQRRAGIAAERFIPGTVYIGLGLITALSDPAKR
jgi:threonine/homoserine/homoserine lactone efflux protein